VVKQITFESAFRNNGKLLHRFGAAAAAGNARDSVAVKFNVVGCN